MFRGCASATDEPRRRPLAAAILPVARTICVLLCVRSARLAFVLVRAVGVFVSAVLFTVLAGAGLELSVGQLCTRAPRWPSESERNTSEHFRPIRRFSSSRSFVRSLAGLMLSYCLRLRVKFAPYQASELAQNVPGCEFQLSTNT